MTPPRRPTLAPGVRLRFDRVRGAHVLVAPERAKVLSETAEAIVRLCDGVHDTALILERLTARFRGDRSVILEDLVAVLSKLAEDGFIVAGPDPVNA